LLLTDFITLTNADESIPPEDNKAIGASETKQEFTLSDKALLSF
jgi:hypothetical protein